METKKATDIAEALGEAASVVAKQLAEDLANAAGVLGQAIPVDKDNTKNRKRRRAEIYKIKKRGRGFTKSLKKKKRRR